MNEDVHIAELSEDVFAMPAELDTAGDTQLLGELLQAIAVRDLGVAKQRSPNDHRTLSPLRERLGERTQEHILTLPGSQTANYADDKWTVVFGGLWARSRQPHH